MIKVDPNSGNMPPQVPTEQKPAGKSYLLNEHIQDTVNFKGDEKPREKSNVLGWVIGLGAVAAGVYYFVKKHNAKPLENAIKQEEKTAAKATEKAGNNHKSPQTHTSTIEPNKNLNEQEAKLPKDNTDPTDYMEAHYNVETVNGPTPGANPKIKSETPEAKHPEIKPKTYSKRRFLSNIHKGGKFHTLKGSKKSEALQQRAQIIKKKNKR